MPYSDNGYPTELANKVGHIRLIQDPMIQSLIESFQDLNPGQAESYPPVTGHVDLEVPSPIEQVIVVDGGNQPVPNIARPERQVGFVQVAALLIRMDTIQRMREDRMIDPRETRRLLGQFTHHTLGALPLAGIHLQGRSVRESIREIVHRFLSYYELYDALSYLVYRQWKPALDVPPSMECLRCGSFIDLPRNAIQFRCGSCNEPHTLADYLGLCDHQSEDRPRLETVSNFRAILEALVLFSFIIRFREHEHIMRRTLFLLDGPLLLRAQLARLVEPIRDLISDQQARGLPLYMVGVEKTGEFRAFADEYGQHLSNPGDYFLPTTRFILESIQGKAFIPSTYRNRVTYGSKVVARVGPHHVLAMNVPTGAFVLDPQPTDLIGFDDIVRTLSPLVSYSFDNALIPIVLANAEASISNQPSGGILAQFIDRILGSNAQ